MHKWYKNICIACIVMGTLIVLTGCQKEIPHYSGYHFDAIIGDAHVIELKDSKSISALKGYIRVRDVYWQLDKPIDGDFTIKFGENQYSKSFIGGLMSRESLGIIPLSDVHIDSEFALTSDNSVQINGAALVKQVNVLKNNHLPVGDYIFRLKIHGSKNWDRKEIYVQVR